MNVFLQKPKSLFSHNFASKTLGIEKNPLGIFRRHFFHHFLGREGFEALERSAIDFYELDQLRDTFDAAFIVAGDEMMIDRSIIAKSDAKNHLQRRENLRSDCDDFVLAKINEFEFLVVLEEIAGQVRDFVVDYADVEEIWVVFEVVFGDFWEAAGRNLNDGEARKKGFEVARELRHDAGFEANYCHFLIGEAFLVLTVEFGDFLGAEIDLFDDAFVGLSVEDELAGNFHGGGGE